jgi:prepilin-type N-terminal cleavage/methylation domain-containing protein
MNPMPARSSARARRRGFTLLEILAAVAIFSILVTMLFQVVRSSLEIWTLGERGKESMEKASGVLDQIAADLRLVHADSPRDSDSAPVRMLADWVEYDLDLDRDAESTTQRLRFVRALPEERFDARLRAAGDVVGASAVLTEGVTLQSATLPPGGLAEVLYTTVDTPEKGGDPSVLRIVRGLQTPIAREDSLLALDLTDDPKTLLSRTVALADGVLYLGFEFWSRDTVDFELPWNSEGGPLSTWDSTRALLLDREGANRFSLAKDADSLARADDDVFPRRVRIVLVIERDADEAELLRLESDLLPTSDRVRVTPIRVFAPGAAHKFVKIGGEWMEWTAIRGDELQVKRGARGTRATSHSAGARARIGETFERTIEIPVYREDWNTR